MKLYLGSQKKDRPFFTVMLLLKVYSGVQRFVCSDNERVKYIESSLKLTLNEGR